RALLGAYQAAIDRLDALAYRLTEAARPAPAPAPKAAGGSPQGGVTARFVKNCTLSARQESTTLSS
ncbi:MAG: hypothetical protein ACRD1G_04995, partial [Acidimicrobiales bacterium]